MRAATSPSDMPEVSRRRQRKLAVLAGLVGTLGALLIAEIAVRLLFGHHTPDTVRRHSLTYRQTVYAPYLFEPVDRLVDVSTEKAWGARADSKEPSGFFISASGYRGPAFEARKPPGVYRIIVVGGSAVFDQNVEDAPDSFANTWSHRVGDALSAARQRRVEVINAGIPGSTSADSLGRVFSQLWMYAPDMLVIYNGWNDVKYWQKLAVTPEAPLIEQKRPWDPTDNPLMYYRGTLDRLLSHSQLYVRVRNRYFLWRLEPDGEGATDADAELASDYGPHGPAQYALSLSLFVEAARAIGATPVIVTQATLAADHNGEADRARIRNAYVQLDHPAVVRAMGETRRIAMDVATRTGAVLVDPAPQMNGRSEWFSDHVHLSPAGSAELARIVASELADAMPDGI